MTRQAQFATTPTTATHRQIDTSLAWAPCFIEHQFPVARISMESYKERKANYSQTLTGLGKWWGRKPLVLVRATILGLLMPASDDPVKDREIFLKLMTMDDEGLWRRKDKSIPQARLLEELSSVPPSLRQRFLDLDTLPDELCLLRLLSKEREALQRLVFSHIPYSEKLQYCRRPEQIDGPSPEAWQEINTHLGTHVTSLSELVEELGRRRFGHRPQVGDSFCGAGSVPFEAARLGCDAYGSDLSPVAALLTWAALHIVGGGEEVARQVQQAQQEIFDTVDRQVTEWGVEHNELGWRADAFLYCVEVRDPESGWMVPLAPSWVIGEKTRTVAKLVPDEATKRYAIEIHEGVSDEEMQQAGESGTVKSYRLVPLYGGLSTPIEVISRNLRMWGNDDLVPHPDDGFQDRLYCIRWCLPNLERLLCFEQVLRTDPAKTIGIWTLEKAETAIDGLMQFVADEERETINAARAAEWGSEARMLLGTFAALADLNADEEATSTDRLGAVRELGRARKALPSEVQPIIEIAKKVPSRTYRAPTASDLKREQKVLELLRERFVDWQRKGYLPSRRIERGKDINRPTNARGWSYWHHFFNPRQLLTNGLFAQFIAERDLALIQRIASLLGLGRIIDWNSRQSRWHPNAANEKGEQTFYKPSLATPLFNYCCRAVNALDTAFLTEMTVYTRYGAAKSSLNDARANEADADIWVTDPPYADAVNYHELSEFFLAWYEKHLSKLFCGWYTDSKRALAIKADDPQVFRQSMVDCYKRLVEHMPENGLQVVMFTHHDASVWADLTAVLWAAGLRVTAAWCIATETDSTLKQGNYVQGTVLLICRKRTEEESVFLDEIAHRVEAEVRRQLDSMLALEDESDPNFGDADYQLAAYAAALRVLTERPIEEIDPAREIIRERPRGEIGPVEQLIRNAVKIACDHLVPRGIERDFWKTLSPMERFYLKGLEVESHSEHRGGVYQELARGFGATDYTELLATTRANQTRLKTASEFGRRLLSGDGFARSLVRQILFATHQIVRSEQTRDGLNWLKTELPDYWNQREKIIHLLDYLAALRGVSDLNHWQKDAEAANLLAGAVRNDHV
jgi:adenine-specific DNA methylase